MNINEKDAQMCQRLIHTLESLAVTQTKKNDREVRLFLFPGSNEMLLLTLGL